MNNNSYKAQFKRLSDVSGIKEDEHKVPAFATGVDIERNYGLYIFKSINMKNIDLQLRLQQHPLDMEVSICDLSPNGEIHKNFKVAKLKDEFETQAGSENEITLCINDKNK